MWIAGPDYFVSIVAGNRGDPSARVVRARRREHLEHFLGYYAPYHEVEEDVDGTRDYRFRTVMNDGELSAILAAHVARMAYTNFKDEADSRDPELGGMYHDWWHDHYGIQERRYRR